MSQKFKKLQNKNDESTAYGKWFATAVYDQRFITTEELAETSSGHPRRHGLSPGPTGHPTERRGMDVRAV